MTECKLSGIDPNQWWISAGGDVSSWPVASDIAAQANVGFQG
jgi:hypothetical protein